MTGSPVCYLYLAAGLTSNNEGNTIGPTSGYLDSEDTVEIETPNTPGPVLFIWSKVE